MDTLINIFMQNPNITIFFQQINSSKVIQTQSYFLYLFNTEETQKTLIIPIFCMLFKCYADLTGKLKNILVA